MKAIILAGGFGTRISEESGIRPKPMVEVGDKPILWHIMKIYSKYGINDFIILCGYKSQVIKDYFSRYALYQGDVTFDMKKNALEIHKNGVEDWRVTLVETGENTMTGGRIKKALPYIGNETFCLTYGDGVSNINIKKLIDFHKSHGRLATVTAVQPPGRFGAFYLKQNQTKVENFVEKPKGDGVWISAGFFVLEPEVMNYIKGDETVWEKEPMEKLSAEGQLSAYRHEGFWQPVDTLRDKITLEKLWDEGNPPWKVWK